MAEIARNAFASRNYRLAAEMYERCLKDNQNSIDIQFGYADSLARSGNFRDALDVYAYCFRHRTIGVESLKHVTGALIDAILGSHTSKKSMTDSNSPTTTEKSSSMSALACVVCEDILVQPVTFVCGHTCCKKCDKSKTCKRCGVTKSSQNLETNVLIKNLTEKLWPYLLNSSKLKEEGNELFQKGDFDGALQKYNQAHELAPDSASVLSNRSHVLLRLGRAHEALQDADSAIKLRPAWGKAHYRRGMALTAMGRHEEALHALACCVVLDRNPNAVRQDIATVLHRLLMPGSRGNHHHSKHNRISSPVQGPYWRAKRNANSSSGGGFLNSRLYSDCEEDSSGDEEPQVSRATSSHQLQRNSRLHGVLDRLFQAVDKILRTTEKSGGEESSTWIAQAVAQTPESSDLDCVLCCRLLWRPVTTPCGHTYCWTCLDRCLDYSHACPLCMAPLADYLASNQRSVTEFVERVACTLLPEEFSARESQQQAELRAAQAERNARVPVFVCTTAFPTVPCPLFVFEPRYRLMVRRAVESGQRQFGIATCVDQNATGQRRYSEFGTILEIKDQVCLASGCSILTTVGCSRFRVLEGGEADGYDLAKVEFLQDEPVAQEAVPGLLKLHEDTKKKANLWVSTLSDSAKAEVARSLGDMPEVEDNWTRLPDGPSWTWWLLALLPLGPKLKVGILGTTNLEKRLRAIDKTLDHIARQRVATRTTVSEPHEDSCQTHL